MIENFLMSSSQAFREGNVPLIQSKPETDEAINEQLYKDVESGNLSEKDYEFMGRLDMAEKLEFMNTQTEIYGYPKVEDYLAAVKSENDRKMDEDNEMREQSGILGDAGYWAAQILTPLLSPVNWPGIITGTLGASSFAQAVLRVGMAETATQLVAQPIIANQKERAGIKYGKGDMFINGVLTVGLASVIGGATAVKLKDIEIPWLNKFSRKAKDEGFESVVEPDVQLVRNGKEMVPEDSATEFIDEVANVNRTRDGRPAGSDMVDDLVDPEDAKQALSLDDFEDMENLQQRQDTTRLDELKAKEKPTPEELDEVEMLGSQQRAPEAPEPEPDPMVARHLKEAEQEMQDAANTAEHLKKFIDCTI
jgi:ethanolamine utilization microcompartment shell protein EutS